MKENNCQEKNCKKYGYYPKYNKGKKRKYCKRHYEKLQLKILINTKSTRGL